jgi:hypothetical protein
MTKNKKRWTVGLASWVHQEGFIWAIFWGDSERGTFKDKEEAINHCDSRNK